MTAIERLKLCTCLGHAGASHSGALRRLQGGHLVGRRHAVHHAAGEAAQLLSGCKESCVATHGHGGMFAVPAAALVAIQSHNIDLDSPV